MLEYLGRIVVYGSEDVVELFRDRCLMLVLLVLPTLIPDSAVKV